MEVSDRWAAFTMPGSLRRAKTAIVGSGTMANDPLESLRGELADYELLLNSLGSACTTIQTAMTLFLSAPEALFEPLQRFFGEDNPSRVTINRFCATLSDFATGVRGAEAQLEAMRNILQEAHQKNSAARDAFEIRDKAWLALAHYENKVGRLHQQVMRNAGSGRLGDKLGRNELKKVESEQAFQNAQAEASKAVNTTLSGRHIQTSQACAKLCHYYVSSFGSSERASRELGDIAYQLVAPNATEAMARRAQELASQATEKAANFAGGLRDRFGNPGQSLSNKFGSLRDDSGSGGMPDASSQNRGADPCASGSYRLGGAASSGCRFEGENPFAEENHDEPAPQGAPRGLSPRLQSGGAGGATGTTNRPSTPVSVPTKVLGATPPQGAGWNDGGCAGGGFSGGGKGDGGGFGAWPSAGSATQSWPHTAVPQEQQPQGWPSQGSCGGAHGPAAGNSPWGAPASGGAAPGHDRTSQFSGSRPQSASYVHASDPWATGVAATHPKGSATPPPGGSAPWPSRTPWA